MGKRYTELEIAQYFKAYQKAKDEHGIANADLIHATGMLPNRTAAGIRDIGFRLNHVAHGQWNFSDCPDYQTNKINPTKPMERINWLNEQLIANGIPVQKKVLTEDDISLVRGSEHANTRNTGCGIVYNATKEVYFEIDDATLTQNLQELLRLSVALAHNYMLSIRELARMRLNELKLMIGE
jgi:hypothetical protein